MSSFNVGEDKPIALVTGVGPGTGSAIVRRFAAGGFRVIALARSPDRIRALEQELADTRAIVCDVSSEREVADAVANVRNSYGPPNVLIHDAVGGGWGNVSRNRAADARTELSGECHGSLVPGARSGAGDDQIWQRRDSRYRQHFRNPRARRILPASPRPRRLSVFCRNRLRAISGRGVSMSPMS